jgi:hypothetical protein
MQQIADWLKKLGLAEYGERFAENGIDVSVLPHLTDQDLKDMGVLLGHRRKMLAAIGELSSQPAAARASDGYTYRAGDPDRVPNRASHGSTRRTPLPHGYVLRPGGLHRALYKARREDSRKIGHSSR